MKNLSSLKSRTASFLLVICMLIQFVPLTVFNSSAALSSDPLRPQLLGGSLDAGDDNILSIFVFGDAMIQANSMMDIVKSFAAKDGIRLDISANTWNNEGRLSSSTGTPIATYNMWELFTWSEYASGSSIRPSSNGNILSPKGTALASFLSALNNSEHPIDHVILLAGRDYSLDWYPDAEQKCVNWFASSLAEHSPNGQLHFFAAPGFSNDYQYTKVLTGTNYTRTQHTARIKQHAQQMSDAITSIDSSVYTIGDGWEAFFTDPSVNQGSALDLYSNDRRNPSLAGSYYNACLLYMMLTNKSPVGMDVYGQMLPEDAKLIQRAAHTYYFGEAPSFTVHNDNGALTLDALTQPCTTDSRLIESNSEYPTYFNELMAAAIAFDQRGSWVQYDQTSFNENTSWDSLYRRVISDNLMAPEQATPQNPYYTDCSAWTTSLYAYTFGFYFNSDGDTTKGSSNLTSTRNLCRLRDTYKNKGSNANLCVWDWGDGSAVTTSEIDAAVNGIYNILQPGDMIVYTSSYGEKLEGHAFMYVGNGYIIHCSGASQAAMGGADFNTAAGHDKHEANGGILVEPLSIFTEPSGHRFIFKQANEVVVLRPSAVRTLTPTAQATARLNNLLNIVAYKETSVSFGQTVTAGQEVTFTYHVKNLNSSVKTVNIVETLPSSLLYVSSDGVYDSSSKKVSFTSFVSPGEEKLLKLTVRVSPTASGVLQMSKTATVNGVYFNDTPIVIGKTLSTAQQVKVAELLPSLTSYTDSYALAKALYTELGYTLPFASGAAALTSVFDFHQASSANTAKTEHYVLTGSSTSGIAMLAPHMFGGQYVCCNHNVTCCPATYTVREGRTSGNYMRTRSMLEDYLIPGDLLVYGNVSASPDTTVYIYAGNSTFYTATSNGLSTIRDSMTVQFLEGMIAKDAFCVLRPSLSLTCSKNDINVLFIGGTSNTSQNRESNLLLESLLKTYGGFTNPNVDALSFGGERVTMYDMFASASSDGVVTLGSTYQNQYNSIAQALSSNAATKYDYVMIALGKEWNLVEQFSYKSKEYGGFAHFEKMIYAHNPDATMVIAAGSGYINMNGSDLPVCLWGSSTQKYYTVGENYADHTANIKAQAYEFKSLLDENSVPLKTDVICIGDAYLGDTDNSLGIYNLGYTTPSKTDTTKEYHHYYLPLESSAYMVAGLMYNTIVGSLPESFAITSWSTRSITSARLTEINSLLHDATSDLRVLYIGGTAATAQMRSSDAALKAMLEEYAGYKNVKVDNISIGERGRLDMIFQSFDANGEPTFHEDYKTYSDPILAALAPDAVYKYDYVFVPVGRDWNLLEDLSYGVRENSGYLWLEKYLYAHNPSATLLVGAPTGYIDVDGVDQEIKFWGSSGQKYWVAGDSFASHTANIKARAEEVTALLNESHLPLNVQLVNYGSAAVKTNSNGFSTHATGYSGSEGSDQMHYYGPDNATAFITAAALFNVITDIPVDTISICDWAADGYGRSISGDCANAALDALKVSLSDINVLLIGGNSVNATESFSHSALELMLERDGGYANANVDVIYLDGWVGRMDNIFSYSGSVADGFTVIGPSTSTAARGAIGQQIIDALSENALVKYDHVVVSVAPFWNLTQSDGGVYGPREIAAFEYTEELLASHNPLATLHIAASQGWMSSAEHNNTGVTEDYKVYAGSSEISFMGNDYAGHTAVIKAQAERIKSKLDGNSTQLNVSILDAGSVMVSLNKQGISTHSNVTYAVHNTQYYAHSNEATAYAFAATAYNSITGNSITDISVSEWNLDGTLATIDNSIRTQMNEIIARELSDISVLMIYGGAFGEGYRDPNKALEKMLATDGGYGNVVVDTITLNGDYGRLDQLFNYSGTKITSIKSESVATYGPIIKKINSALAADASFKYDHIVIVTGGNWPLTDSVENFPVREANAFSYFEEMIYAHNPDATLYITTPKGWMTAEEYAGQSGDYTITISSGRYYVADNFAHHNERLLEQAENISLVLKDNSVPLNVKIADFASAATAASNDGKVLHTSTTKDSFGKPYHIYSSALSAHLYASVLFGEITGLPYYSTTVTNWGSNYSITPNELADLQEYTKISLSVGETMTGYSLTLQGGTNGETGGDIGINLKMTVSEELANDSGAYVKVKYRGKETITPLSQLHYNEKDGKYYITTLCAAKEMSEIVSAAVYNGKGECGSTYSYSVKGYAQQIVNNKQYASLYPELVPLLKSMLNYGAAAQVYFNYNADKPTNSGLSYADGWKAIEDIQSIDNVTSAVYNGSVEEIGLAKHSVSLVLNAETVIKHYITLGDGADISDYTFTVDGKVVTPIKSDDRYYISIDHIAAWALDSGYTFTVTRNADNAVYSVSYSAMNYIKAMFEACRETPSYANLCDLLRSMYLYNSAANIYFGK